MSVNRASGAVGDPAAGPFRAGGVRHGRGRRWTVHHAGLVLLLAAGAVTVALALVPPTGTDAAFTVRATTPPIEVVGPSPEASPSPSVDPGAEPTPAPSPAEDAADAGEPSPQPQRQPEEAETDSQDTDRHGSDDPDESRNPAPSAEPPAPIAPSP